MERRSRPGSSTSGGDSAPILPVTNAQATSSASASVGRKRGTKSQTSSSNLFATLCFFSILSLAVVGCVKWLTKDLEEQNKILTIDAAMSRAAMESNIKNLQAQLEQVTQEKEELETKQKEDLHSKEKPASDGDENAIKQLNERLDNVHKEIQKMSKRDAIQKFGLGPHKVEIELDFPPEAPAVDGNPTKFIIEMASLEEMPHSVHLFLEMVDRKLWDGCAFMRNAGHVVQASSVPYYKTEGQQLLKKFKESGFLSVAFQEYSPNVPHKKYTVGFAGRPGGPDWYVSTVDNTENHGPGGQSSYAIPGEADPCFGKVIQGFDAVDRMHKLPVKPGWYNALEHNVGIAKARIIH